MLLLVPYLTMSPSFAPRNGSSLLGVRIIIYDHPHVVFIDYLAEVTIDVGCCEVQLDQDYDSISNANKVTNWKTAHGVKVEFEEGSEYAVYGL